jgi:4-carboxymuconolactone decarboxylase
MANDDPKADRPGASRIPEPPKTYKRFVAKYPKLEEAWSLVHQAGAEGPLDDRTQKLVKLAIAVGAMREGAVHSAARKARGLGIGEDEISQVVALATSTLGFPSTVAVFSWLED